MSSKLPPDIQGLSPDQRRALLENLLKAQSAVDELRIPRALQPTRWASLGQERIWLVEQMSPGKAVYNVPNPVRIQGELDVRSLERALGEIARRHEILRTTYSSASGRLVQVVRPAEFWLPVLDLSNLAAGQRAVRLAAQLHEDAHRSFDLTAENSWRAHLIQLSAREYILSLTIHHIATDNWSWAVFFKELAALYQAFKRGNPSPLPELSIQYSDFAIWEREVLPREIEPQVAYWRDKLRGAPELLNLPTDHPRPAVRRFVGRAETFTLDARLVSELERASRRVGGTLFMGLLASYGALLSRYSREKDLVIGTPVANRSRIDTEPLIGFFVNTLALRLDLSGRPSFRELLERVRTVAVDAYDHQDAPFERLVEILRPASSRSHTPIFQTLLNINQDPLSDVVVEGLRLSLTPPPITALQFDLVLSLQRREGGFDALLAFDEDLFDPGFGERLGAQYTELMRAMLSEPEGPLARASLLSAAERKVWSGWTPGKAPRPTLVSLFLSGASANPEGVALVDAKKSIGFRELEARSRSIALKLRTLGLGAESRVGLMMRQSVDAICALLSILRAGYAYVPLDPESPGERLQYVLHDASPGLVIVDEGLQSRTPPHDRVVTWENLSQQASDDASEDDFVPLDPDALAYLIYTSGSTGVPKGVAVSHGATANNIQGVNARFQITPRDRMMQIGSFNFDGSLHEIFSALAAGATLTMCPPNVRGRPDALNAFVRDNRLSVVGFVPSVVSQLVPETLPEVRIVYSAGETCPTELVQRWTGRARFFNLYGPTEVGITATVAECEPGAGRPPIGTSLTDVVVYVVDEELQLQPVGVPGELLVGGLGLARGYWGNAVETATRFIPNPFSAAPGARLYRTGDLARTRNDGQLEYLGRIDQQLKLRGFRIEVGEIEAQLLAHPSVRGAAVVARRYQGEPRLVGYVIPTVGSQCPADLESFLRSRLPSYALPSVLIGVVAFPLTTTGKLDAQALPEPPEAIVEYVAPRNNTEVVVAQLFSELLHRERVGSEDDFFQLGGHSLTAGQLVSRIRSRFSVEVPISAVFDCPSVSGLANAIEEALQRGLADEIPLARAAEKNAISIAQEQLWFLEQLHPGEPTYNFAFEVALVGDLRVAVLERSLAEVVRRHAPLRSTFHAQLGRPEVVVGNAAPFSLPLHDLSLSGLATGEREGAEIAHAAAVRPFDLSRGPLFRASLLRLAPQEHRLVIVMHHVITDGRSIEILLQDLAAAYSAGVQGRPIDFSPLAVEFADFATWQRRCLTTPSVRRKIEYWKQKLAGAAPLLALPLDRARPEIPRQSGDQVMFQFSDVTRARLAARCLEVGVSPFMWLSAAFSAVLHQHTRQDDICIGVPTHGRSRSELDPLVGLFANTVVLRTSFSKSSTFQTLLQAVRDSTLEAFANEVPFQAVVEAVQPQRRLDYSPIFQVMFSLLVTAEREPEMNGLAVKVRGLEIPASKFDLSLSVEQNPDRLEGAFEYNIELLDRSTIERMAEHFLNLVQESLNDPSQAVEALPFPARTELSARPGLILEEAVLQSRREPPRGVLEELVAGAFTNVLGGPLFSRDDNFFEMGGHSLGAVEVAARLGELLHQRVSVQTIFQAPVIKDLAVRLGALVPTSPDAVPIRGDSLRPTDLSFQQESFWFLHHLSSSTTLNSIPSAYRLRGALDLVALGAAHDEIVRRHAIFRTLFRIVDGRPAQCVQEHQSGSLPIVDLSHLPEAQRESELLRTCDVEARRPFEIGTLPLWRRQLVRLGPRSHVLLWVFHHIVHDAWSEQILLRELNALYAALSRGSRSPLSEPLLQYADFARWQRGEGGGALDSQIEFWKVALQGVPLVLDLPIDHSRPAISTFEGAQLSFEIPGSLVASIEIQCREQGVTLFMYLLAAYGAFLGRLAGEDDVVIGAPVAGRDRLELQSICGPFINTLPLRVDFSEETTFEGLLQRAKERVLGAFGHQDVPIERIIEATREARDLSRSPLMHSSLVLLPKGRTELRLENVELVSLDLDRGSAKQDLALMLAHETTGLHAVFEYSTDLFDRGSISRFVGRFLSLLSSTLERPGLRVSELNLWSVEERAYVLEELNATARPFPATATAHGLFEMQVARAPLAAAVTYGSSTLSYGELDGRANRLAHFLRNRGVGSGCAVAVSFGPSIESVIALYGILKAGAAYVPFDPDSPEDRVRFLLDNSGAVCLLTVAALKPKLSVHLVDAIALDDNEEIAAQPNTSLGLNVHPEAPAYIVYTSGTTGEPKGVIIPHRALVNHNLAVSERFKLRAGDRLLQFTPLHFDAAGEEIYPPLLSGAEIVVRGELVPYLEFRDLIVDQRLSVLSLPPAYFHEWVAEMMRQQLTVPPSLRLIILGGEKIVPETFRNWLQIGGAAVPWLNVYGPTEATITSAMCEIATASSLDADAKLPIGRPIANVQVFIVDGDLQAVLPGMTGEICIGGKGLAHGYIGRAAETGERFVPNPFSSIPGARMYRTGDLGRHLLDGRIEFVGRKDFQVKLRGHRIELGEIESALRRHPGVESAIALVREDIVGQKRIVAYYVSQGTGLSVAQVQGFLRDKLPAYMMPGAFVSLPAIPLTSGGKVDRRALPPPATLEHDEPSVAPETELETSLVRLWEEVLEAQPIGVTTNFFESGGHSLLAIELLGRMREELGIDVPITDFFNAPTIRGVVGRAEPAVSVTTRSPLIALSPVKPGEDRPILFCIHPLFGDIQIYYQLAMRLGPEQPAYGLRAPERDGETTFTSVAARAAAYIEQMWSVQPSGPYFIAAYGDAGPIGFEIAQQLTLIGESVGALLLVDSDLEQINKYREPDGDPRAVALEHWSDLKFQFSVEFERFGRPERWAEVITSAQTTGTGLGAQEFSKLARTAHQIMKGLAAYRPSPFSGRVVQLSAAGTIGDRDASLGWKSVAPTIKTIVVPGNHLTMLDSPNVEVLAQHFRAQLVESAT